MTPPDTLTSAPESKPDGSTPADAAISGVAMTGSDTGRASPAAIPGSGNLPVLGDAAPTDATVERRADWSGVVAGVTLPAVAGLVADARRAAPGWAELPVAERLAVVERFRRMLADRAVEAAESAAAGTDHPVAEKLTGEVLPLADAAKFLERNAVRLLAPHRQGSSGRPFWLSGVDAEVRREPLGVVLLLAPGNYPLFLPGVQALQALVAGNAVLWKPAAGGMDAAVLFAGMMADAGLPDGLLTVLPDTVEAGRDAMAAGVDKVVLTGSAATGREVLAGLAPTATPAVVELSGCDAVFVLDGADVGDAARAVAFGLRLNGGSTCIGPRRAFVPTAIAEEFARSVAGQVAGIPPRRHSGRTRSSIRSIVDPAVAAGAVRKLAGTIDEPAGTMTPHVLIAGPSAGSGPAIPAVGGRLRDVSVDPLASLHDDLFAPVLTVFSVSDPEDALRQAARSPYALGASIFGPETEARRFAGRVRAGSVCINDLIVPTADPRLPFGGRGASGHGVTRGAEGLMEMTTVKVVSVRRGAKHHLDAPRDDDAEFFATYIRAAHGGGWWSRLRARLRLIRLLWKRM